VHQNLKSIGVNEENIDLWVEKKKFWLLELVYMYIRDHLRKAQSQMARIA
jgi:hypothetical protein